MFFSAKKAANFPRGGFLSNSCAMLVFTHDTPRASDDRFEGWFSPGVAYAHIEYGSKECDGNFCFERRNTLNLYFKEHASWRVKVVCYSTVT